MVLRGEGCSGAIHLLAPTFQGKTVERWAACVSAFTDYFEAKHIRLSNESTWHECEKDRVGTV